MAAPEARDFCSQYPVGLEGIRPNGRTKPCFLAASQNRRYKNRKIFQNFSITSNNIDQIDLPMYFCTHTITLIAIISLEKFSMYKSQSVQSLPVK